MIYNILLIFFQIKIVQNAANIFGNINNLRYAIPLIHNSKIYLFGYKKVIYGSDINSFST